MRRARTPARTALVAGALLGMLTACGPDAPTTGSASTGTTATPAGAPSAAAKPAEPLTLQQIIDATQAGPGSRMTFASIVKSAEGKPDSIVTCTGHITFQPKDAAAWACAPNKAFASSIADATSSTLASTLASMSSRVIVVGNTLYSDSGLNHGGPWFRLDMTSEDKCMSDATAYCGSPGNVFYLLTSQPWRWTPTAHGITGTLAMEQGGAQVTGKATLKADSSSRLTSLRMTSSMTANGSTLTSVATVTLSRYAKQKPVKAPASSTRP